MKPIAWTIKATIHYDTAGHPTRVENGAIHADFDTDSVDQEFALAQREPAVRLIADYFADYFAGKLLPHTVAEPAPEPVHHHHPTAPDPYHAPPPPMPDLSSSIGSPFSGGGGSFGGGGASGGWGGGGGGKADFGDVKSGGSSTSK